MEVQALSPETIQDTIPLPPQTSQPTSIPTSSIDSHFSKTTNLASTALGSTVLSFSDEWFAAASNLLTPTPAVHKPGVYDHRGAWYDGWETRRHNPEEYDWVVVKLGVASGIIAGVEVDTAFFNGNQAEQTAVQGTFLPRGSLDGREDEEVAKEGYTGWQTILSPQECGPSQRHGWAVAGKLEPVTHVRLLMYPDGGIARLRLYGHAVPPPFSATADEKAMELSAAINGGTAIACSDQHFGVISNLLLPGRGKDMGDGWETSRSRAKGHEDWVIVKLGLKASISKVIVDTAFFRGNFPRAVRVHGWEAKEDSSEEPAFDDKDWVDLLDGEKACKPDNEHVFEGNELSLGSRGDKIWSYAKLSMVPDGGVKRFRIFGKRKAE